MLGRQSVPLHGPGMVLRHLPAVGVDQRRLVLGFRVAAAGEGRACASGADPGPTKTSISSA